MYACMYVCTKSFLKTTTNSSCVCTHLANKADSDLSRAFVYRPVDPSRAFVDCVRECGSLACICGLCAQVWISRVHLWEDLIQFSLHIIRTNWMLA